MIGRLVKFNPYPAGTEPKKKSAFATNIELGQPIHVYSLTRHYPVGWLISNSHLDLAKINNGQFQKCKVNKSI